MGQASSYAKKSVERALNRLRLSEMEDENEVLRLCGYCRGDHPSNPSQSSSALKNPMVTCSGTTNNNNSRTPHLEKRLSANGDAIQSFSNGTGASNSVEPHVCVPPPATFGPLIKLDGPVYSLDELRATVPFLPEALHIDLNRFSLLYVLDADGDGRFSQEDIMDFVQWAIDTLPAHLHSDSLNEALQATCALECFRRCRRAAQLEEGRGNDDDAPSGAGATGAEVIQSSSSLSSIPERGRPATQTTTTELVLTNGLSSSSPTAAAPNATEHLKQKLKGKRSDHLRRQQQQPPFIPTPQAPTSEETEGGAPSAGGGVLTLGVEQDPLRRCSTSDASSFSCEGTLSMASGSQYVYQRHPSGYSSHNTHNNHDHHTDTTNNSVSGSHHHLVPPARSSTTATATASASASHLIQQSYHHHRRRRHHHHLGPRSCSPAIQLLVDAGGVDPPVLDSDDDTSCCSSSSSACASASSFLQEDDGPLGAEDGDEDENSLTAVVRGGEDDDDEENHQDGEEVSDDDPSRRQSGSGQQDGRVAGSESELLPLLSSTEDEHLQTVLQYSVEATSTRQHKHGGAPSQDPSSALHHHSHTAAAGPALLPPHIHYPSSRSRGRQVGAGPFSTQVRPASPPAKRKIPYWWLTKHQRTASGLPFSPNSTSASLHPTNGTTTTTTTMTSTAMLAALHLAGWYLKLLHTQEVDRRRDAALQRLRERHIVQRLTIQNDAAHHKSINNNNNRETLHASGLESTTILSAPLMGAAMTAGNSVVHSHAMSISPTVQPLFLLPPAAATGNRRGSHHHHHHHTAMENVTTTGATTSAATSSAAAAAAAALLAFSPSQSLSSLPSLTDVPLHFAAGRGGDLSAAAAATAAGPGVSPSASVGGTTGIGGTLACSSPSPTTNASPGPPPPPPPPVPGSSSASSSAAPLFAPPPVTSAAAGPDGSVMPTIRALHSRMHSELEDTLVHETARSYREMDAQRRYSIHAVEELYFDLGVRESYGVSLWALCHVLDYEMVTKVEQALEMGSMAAMHELRSAAALEELRRRKARELLQQQEAAFWQERMQPPPPPSSIDGLRKATNNNTTTANTITTTTTNNNNNNNTKASLTEKGMTAMDGGGESSAGPPSSSVSFPRRSPLPEEPYPGITPSPQDDNGPLSLSKEKQMMMTLASEGIPAFTISHHILEPFVVCFVTSYWEMLRELRPDLFTM